MKYWSNSAFFPLFITNAVFYTLHCEFLFYLAILLNPVLQKNNFCSLPISQKVRGIDVDLYLENPYWLIEIICPYPWTVLSSFIVFLPITLFFSSLAFYMTLFYDNCKNLGFMAGVVPNPPPQYMLCPFAALINGLKLIKICS